jgi:hypothetical protein
MRRREFIFAGRRGEGLVAGGAGATIGNSSHSFDRGDELVLRRAKQSDDLGYGNGEED